MNRTGWIIFGVVVVALLGGLIAWTRLTNPPIDISDINANAVISANSANGNIADHVMGKSTDSKVVLVEYGDFQCPSCGGAHPAMKQLGEEYGDRVTIIFRNFPLTTIHPNALAAAGAAEAAGLQGKYWEMHNMLFENQSSWSSLDSNRRVEAFTTFAEGLGVDGTKFKEDLASTSVTSKIRFDQALADATGKVSGTPTFFLNGEKVGEEAANGLVNGNAAPMKELLDKALAK